MQTMIMTPTFFKGPADFRKWLAKNYKKETELLVGFYKVETGKCTMTWSQSVDEALCYGWIDGVRKSIDKDSYTIRFTPRKKGSNWSAVNVAKVEALTTLGLMQPAGIASFQNREASGAAIYSYENDEVQFPPQYVKKFKSNAIAWKYFQSLAPSYKKTSKNWVMSAKQETTRVKRLEKLIEDSQAGTNQWRNNKYNKPKKA